MRKRNSQKAVEDEKEDKQQGGRVGEKKGEAEFILRKRAMEVNFLPMEDRSSDVREFYPKLEPCCGPQ